MRDVRTPLPRSRARPDRLVGRRSNAFLLGFSASLGLIQFLLTFSLSHYSLPKLPWFAASVEAFCLGGGFSIAFLCLGRYLFKEEPYALSVATAFWLSSLINLAYLLAREGVLPSLQPTATYLFYLLYLALLIPCFVPAPGSKVGWPVRGRMLITTLGATSLLCLLVIAAIAYLKGYLPFLSLDVHQGSVSRFLPYAFFFVYLAATYTHWQAARHREQPLMGYFLSFLVVSLWVFPGIILSSETYDISWYTWHLLRSFGYVSVYLGLLLDYLGLYRELGETLDRMTVIHHLNALVSGSLNLEEISQTVSREIQKLVPYDRLAINLLRRDQKTIRVYSEESRLPSSVMPRGVGPKEGTATGWVIDHQQPLICEDTLHPGDALHEQTFPGTFQRYREVGIRSFMMLPLTAKQKPLGVLNLGSLAPACYSSQDVVLVSPLAEILSLAIENSNLFEEVRRRSGEFEALAKINRDIASLVRGEVLLPHIAEAARRMLDVDGCTFRLLEGGLLVTAGHSGPGDLPVSRRVLKPGESITGKVFAENRPLIIRDLREDSTLIEQHRQVLLAAGYRSFLGVPLRVGERAIGTITLFSKEEREFRPDEVDLITAFADQAAIAVENARLFAELEKTNAQFQAANKELEAFSYSVSHDLRAPLRSIDGFSQALLEDYGDKLDGQAKDYLGRVRAGSQRMGQLIDDLLNLSRVTRTEMRHESVDLSEIARAIAAELQRAEPGRRVAFAIPETLVATGDARLLRIVLENLLGNAWKFTARHPGAHIEVGLADNGGRPAYFVRDDGAGFDMAYAGKLFGAFQRLHAATEFKGSGIGLATVQRIIHRHGGRVWAEGEVEKGSTFYFTLPT